MIATEGFHDICGEFIPRNTDRLITDDTGQGYDRDTGRTAANVDDHITNGLFHVNSNPQCSGHRFMDQVYFFGPGLLGAVPDGSFFYFGDAGGYTDHHSPAGGEERLFAIDHLAHLPDHQ